MISVIDWLKKVIEDYNNGLKTEDETLVYIELMEWKDQNKFYKNNKKVIKLIKDDYLRTISRTPLEILEEEEKLQYILELFTFVKHILSEEEFDILYSYAVNGETQESISQRYNVSQQAINRKIKKIFEKVQKAVVESLDPEIYNRSLFSEPQSTLEIGKPKVMNMPHEFLKNVSNGRQLRVYADGRKRWFSKSVCKIPEYLLYSFKTNNVKCSLCYGQFQGENKCKNKLLNGGDEKR